MLIQGFVDLDELLLLCRDKKAKEHISEAIICFKAGAFRQSIVAAWIAVVYDFIFKLQELERNGDKNARTILHEFEEMRVAGDIRKSLEFERRILDLAKDEFDLITSLEYTDLSRLQEDRNRCAHPTMLSFDETYKPSAEQARSHIRNAVDYMLQRPPVQGKAALEKLISEVNSDYFPTDIDSAIEFWRTGPLIRPRESLVRNFTIVLMKTLVLEDLNDKSYRHHTTAICALLRMHRPMVLEAIQSSLNSIFQRLSDSQLFNALDFLDTLPDCWNFLTEDVQKRLQNFARTMPDDDIDPLLLYALDLPALRDAALQRLNSISSGRFIYDLIQRDDHDEPRKEFLDKAVDLYVDSTWYGEVNYIATNIIIPFVRSLQPLQVQKIVEAIQTNRYLLNSFTYDDVINALERCGAEKLRDSLDGVSITAQCPCNGDLVLGNVTKEDIVRILHEKGFDVDSDEVQLEEPIKQLGIHEVSIELHPDVTPKIKVWVVKERELAT